jgi:hypothetical protein
MVTYLGASPADAATKVIMTEGAHVLFTYLKAILGIHLIDARQAESVGDVTSLDLPSVSWYLRRRGP